MLDIMKCQFRTIRSKGIIHIINIMLLLTSILILFVSAMAMSADEAGTEKPILTATEYIPKALQLIMGLSMFGGTCLTALAVSDDFGDKTIYHELAAGRKRSISFFGRAIPALIASPIVCTALYMIPFILYGIVYGWGNALPTGNLILRAVLALFPLVRMSAFCVMTSFICKQSLSGSLLFSMYAPMFGMSMLLGSSILPFMNVATKLPWLTSASNFVNLGKFECWTTYDLGLNQFFTYNTELSASGIALTIVCSVVMTAVYLLIGYHSFHVDDMN